MVGTGGGENVGVCIDIAGGFGAVARPQRHLRHLYKRGAGDSRCCSGAGGGGAGGGAAAWRVQTSCGRRERGAALCRRG